MIGTVGAGEVALADEPPLDPAPCSVTAFKLVAMMNWHMLCGLPGKVDQVIAWIQNLLILRCRMIPDATHPRRGGEGGLTSRKHRQSTCTPVVDMPPKRRIATALWTSL